ncbi:hypothetical protein [Desulfosarcina ovata]|uniref:Uncharacterized protein n=2 Tax=Desulfosarcina ovata TaxID=83564 RepID=A0A5K8A881_9BACT|nr:hypothetical protein [Desulfosarcina ovata]BBO81592.1 hypothetical protein DSCO28_21580 [Desulfosarcina ovata subsp. sediminis]BBO88832.1 hypothetical protein DSCOOX_20120 [Desulfosarcina ovata subsp. ovata]
MKWLILPTLILLTAAVVQWMDNLSTPVQADSVQFFSLPETSTAGSTTYPPAMPITADNEP